MFEELADAQKIVRALGDTFGCSTDELRAEARRLAAYRGARHAANLARHAALDVRAILGDHIHALLKQVQDGVMAWPGWANPLHRDMRAQALAARGCCAG